MRLSHYVGFLIVGAGTLAAAACGSDTVDGVREVSASDLTRVVELLPGEVCSAGGLAVLSGKDENGNGALDDAEVTGSINICSGVDGSDGPSGSDGEDGDSGPSGADGEDGDSGEDGADGNNGEDGSNGTSTLASVSVASPEDCPAGGSIVSFGADLNSNGELDAGEVQNSVVTCNGEAACSPVVRLTTVESGEQCEAGGIEIAVGQDDGGDDAEAAGGAGGASSAAGSCDGILSTSEVDDVKVVCSGVTGEPGAPGAPGEPGEPGAPGSSAAPLVRIRLEMPGSNCYQGGHRIDVGSDLNGNGSLQDNEVNSTGYICKGDWIPLSAGSICSNWSQAGVTEFHCGPTDLTARADCSNYCASIDATSVLHYGKNTSEYVAWGSAAQVAAEICHGWDGTCQSSDTASFWSMYSTGRNTLCNSTTRIECSNSWWAHGSQSNNVACNCYR